MIILGTNSIKDTGFDVANSCRFNEASADSLHRATGETTGATNWTLSTWIKRSTLGSLTNGGTFMGWYSATNKRSVFGFNDSDKLYWWSDNGSGTQGDATTAAVFRDSAWYHVVLRIDTTQSSQSDRVKIYVNNVEQSLTFSGSHPTQNEANTGMYGASYIGSSFYNTATDRHFGGYLAETVMIDDASLNPDQFAEADENSSIWKPIDVSGLTFGSDGFYLDYKDSSALGNDANGSNNLTVTNLTAIDQSTSTCTNNFCTINSLDNFYAAATLAEGNLKVTCNAGNTSFITGTFGLTKGKWYWEGKLTTVGGEEAIGITDIVSTATNNYAGQTANSYTFQGNNGNIRNNDGNTSYGSAYGTSVIGVYMDLDNNKLYFAINGTIQNSGTGFNITDPTSTTNGFYFPMVGDVDSDAPVWEVNFGNPVSALSSAVADANGYGSFEYDPSAGTFDSASKDFLAICTKNLAEYG